MNNYKIIIKAALILFLTFTLNSLLNAQANFEEVVYLKNGSIIRGIIIETIPSKGIKIQTKDMNIFYFSNDEIEKITKEIKPDTHSSNSSFSLKSFKLGYGSGTFYNQAVANFTVREEKHLNAIGPLFASFELRAKYLSIGLALNYQSNSSAYVFKYGAMGEPIGDTYLFKNFQVLAKLGFHFVPIGTKFDPYLSLGIGFNKCIDSWKDAQGFRYVKPILPEQYGYSIHLGAKYLFKKKIGPFLEVGYGQSIICGGLAFEW